MKGKIVVFSQNSDVEPRFGIEMHGQIYPAETDAVLLRDLHEGSEVQFLTDREGGNALIVLPPKTRGFKERSF